MTAPHPFDRAGLEAAFEALGQRARRDGLVIDIAIYGGAAMIFAFDARPATKDVDAVFEADRGWVRFAAERIAEQFGWQADWINDGVKGFLSAADREPGAKRLLRSYPDERDPAIRVYVAVPEYLFAMKAMAMRAGGVEGDGDIADLRLLGDDIGVRSAEAAVAIVERYYPAGRITPKTRFGLEALFDG